MLSFLLNVERGIGLGLVALTRHNNRRQQKLWRHLLLERFGGLCHGTNVNSGGEVESTIYFVVVNHTNVFCESHIDNESKFKKM